MFIWGGKVGYFYCIVLLDTKQKIPTYFSLICENLTLFCICVIYTLILHLICFIHFDNFTVPPSTVT